jgi:hypothetical protein
MTTPFEDHHLGISVSDSGVLTVYARNYKDGRPSSLVVKDNNEIFVVVEEVPPTAIGDSLISIAIRAYETV